MIKMYLGQDSLNEIKPCRTALDIWRKLEAGKGLTGKLYSLKMKHNEDLTEHLHHFNALVQELEGMSVKIEDEDKAILLLCSPPDSFDNLITAMLIGKDTIKYEEVVVALRSNEMKHKLMKSNTSEVYVSNQSGGRIQSRGPVNRQGSNHRSGSRNSYLNNRGRYNSNSRSSSRSNSQARGSNNNYVRKCFNCGKPGHIARFCRAPKRNYDRGDPHLKG